MSALKIYEKSLTFFRDVKPRECFIVPDRNKRDVYYKCHPHASVNAINLLTGHVSKFEDSDEVIQVSSKLETYPSTTFFA